MTKKDYEAIAEVFEAAEEFRVAVVEENGPYYPEWAEGFNSALEAISQGLIKVFEEDNSRFDSERFLKACGL